MFNFFLEINVSMNFLLEQANNVSHLVRMTRQIPVKDSVWFQTEGLFRWRASRDFPVQANKQNKALQSVLLLYLLKRLCCQVYCSARKITVNLQLLVMYLCKSIFEKVIKKMVIVERFLLLHIFFIAQYWTVFWRLFISSNQECVTWLLEWKTMTSFVLVVLVQPLSAGRSPWCAWPRSRGCRQRCGWTR